MNYEHIILSNFPSSIASLSAMNEKGEDIREKEFRYTGFIRPEDYSVLLDNSIEKIFISLLLYKEIYLSDRDFLKIIYVKKNIGYGNGILQGLKKAKGKFISWTHADLQTDPYDTIRGFEKYKKKLSTNVYIKGKRYGRKIKDTFFTIGMSFFESILLGKFLWDINAQPNIIHKKFFKSLNKIPLDFSLDLFFYYNAKKQNLKIFRFPVKFYKRKFGYSHWNISLKNKMKFIKKTIKYSLKLRKQLEN